MGSTFIITESMLEKKGRELMLDFYNCIHDNYYLTETKPESEEKNFEEFIAQRKYWDENAVDCYKKIVLRDGDVSILRSSPVLISSLSKLEGEELLKHIEDKIKNETIELKFVFEFLKDMDKKLNLDSSLEFEANEDLFCLKKAFLKAYDLFHYSGGELI